MGRLTAHDSISGLRASGLGRLRACECVRACVRVGPPFPLHVLVASATLPAKGIKVSTLLLVIDLFILVE